TAADVQYTWKAIMQPDHNVATRYGYDRIDSVETPNPQTVVVHFKDAFAPWATLFDVILPQHILEKETDFNGSRYHQQPVGFGPFKVTENIKGDHTTYDAFDGYRRGRPKIDRIFIRYFGNTDAELQALKAKEIDLAWGVPLSNIPDLAGLGWRAGADGIRQKAGQRRAFDHTTTSGSQLRENVQLLIQQNFKDVGVEMNIKNQPTDQLFGSYAAGGVWARGTFQMGGWT